MPKFTKFYSDVKELSYLVDLDKISFIVGGCNKSYIKYFNDKIPNNGVYFISFYGEAEEISIYLSKKLFEESLEKLEEYIPSYSIEEEY